MISSLFLALVAFTPLNALDLQTTTSAGGPSTSWITCPADQDFDVDGTLAIRIRNNSTGWFAGGRFLMGQSGKVVVRVLPVSGGSALSVLLTGTDGVTVTRTVPLSSFTPRGKFYHEVTFVKQGQTARLYVDGIERVTSGTGVVPLHLKVLAASTLWQVGAADFLKGQVSNFRRFNRALSTAEVLAIWDRGGTCALNTTCEDPYGESVTVGVPSAQYILDAFPLSPTVGTGNCNVICNTPPCGASLTTSVPKTPTRGDDAVAFSRFQLKNSFEGYDTTPYWGFDGLALLDNGDLLAAYSVGDGHTSGNISYTARSTTGGATWPWPLGQAWPSVADAAQVGLAPGGILVAKGNSFCVLANGRVLQFANVLPGEGTVPPGARYSTTRYSDNNGMTWSSWAAIPNTASKWMNMPAGGSCVELPNGTILKGAYDRACVNDDTTNCVSENWYRAVTIGSTDGGVSFHFNSIIASGEVPLCTGGGACQNDVQFEEPEVGWILEDCPGSVNGSCLFALMRVDYPYPGRTFGSYSYDQGATWTVPHFAYYGFNYPNWKETCEGALISATRSSLDTGLTHLFASYDKGMSWQDIANLSLTSEGDLIDMGHSIVIDYATCDVHMLRASERGSSLSILEYMHLKHVWAACGDSMLQAGEQCDDGNTVSGDGCTNICTTETGYMCTPVCDGVRGDGLIRGTEECDNGSQNGNMSYGSPPCRANGTEAMCSSWN